MTKSRAKKNRLNASQQINDTPQIESAGPRREPVLRVIAEWVQARLIRLPRLVRIMLAAVLALALTGAIFPLVDQVYIQYFFTPETRIVPSYVSAGLGALVYLVGWLLIVGPTGENRVSSHPMVVVYLLTGMVALCLDIVLVIQGFAMTDVLNG